MIRKPVRKGDGRARHPREQVRLHPEPVVQHAHLQGHAERRSDRPRCSRIWPTPTWTRHWPWSISGSAPTPSRRGRWRIPYRYVAHNGEINTLRGNINWMRAREALCRSEVLGERPAQGAAGDARGAQRHGDVRQRARVPRHERPLAAARDPHDDSGAVAEPRVDERRAAGLLRVPLLADGAVGRPCLHRVHRRQRHRGRARPQRPAAVALLRDQGRPGRHGLRGRRAGHPAAGHRGQGAAAPGPASSWSTPRRAGSSTTRRSRPQLAAEHPYADWLAENVVRTGGPARPSPARGRTTTRCVTRQIAFGYTHEDLRMLLGPMAKNGEEPIGSMGTDTALAVLSDRPRPLYDYFKQLFAQVTNPPLDQIREELVTSMESTIGPEGNLLQADAGVVPADRHPGPGAVQRGGGQAPSRGAPVVPVGDAADALPGRRRAPPAWSGRSESCRPQASAGHRRRPQHRHPVRSRRHARSCAAIPSLLATAAVHHHLVRRGERTRCGLVVETGDAREVHHMCLLIGYGAGAVNPWVAFETLDDMIRQELLTGVDHAKAIRNYIKALNKGILKVMAKMGISTLQSYCGAQIFEAIGLNRDLVDRYFTGTASRVSGIGIEVIAEEVRRRHDDAYPDPADRPRRPGLGRRVPVAARRRVPPVQPRHGLQAAARDALRPGPDLPRLHEAGRRPEPAARHAARADRAQAGRRAGAAGRGGARGGDPQALRHRRHVLRLDQPGGARDPGHRHEPHRRQVEHRRRRRGPRPLPARSTTATGGAAPSSRWPRPASA